MTPKGVHNGLILGKDIGMSVHLSFVDLMVRAKYRGMLERGLVDVSSVWYF